MTPSKTYQIERLAFGGDGVAHHEGKVVFIPNTIPGEVVTARVIRQTPRCDFATLEAILTPSPSRIEPLTLPSAVYSHMAYPIELAAKAEQLQWFLKRQPDVVHGAEAITGYRNKITLRANGRGALGYCIGTRAQIVDVPTDPLAHNAINEALSDLRENRTYLRDLKVGTTVTLRYTPLDGVHSWRSDQVVDYHLTESTPIGNLRVRADGFWQVNTAQADKLFRTVAEHMPGGETLLDLYCGAGVFGLLLAHKYKRTHGIELSAGAIEDARANAQAYGVNAEYQCGDCAKLADSALRSQPITSILVDPPRAGLAKEVIKTILTHRPEWIGYVSCAPDTLARDWQRLSEAYCIKRLELIDLFPRTQHFETFVLLQRKDLAS